MDNLRTFFIFGLLIVSLLLWEAWQNDYVRPEQLQAQQSATTTVEENSVTAAAADLPDMPVAQSLDGLPDAHSSETISSTKVRVTTDLIDVIIDTKGADIKELSLLAYPVESTEPDVAVKLLEESAAHNFILQSGLRSDAAAPTHYDLYQSAQNEYQLSDGSNELIVPLTWQTPSGLKVTKTYRFKRDSYLIEVDYAIENNSGERFTASPYAQFNRNRPEDDSGFIYTYTGAVFSTPANKYEKIDFDELDDAKFKKSATNGWAAMIQHYFVGALIPKNDQQEVTFHGKSINKTNYTAGMTMPILAIADGQIGHANYQMYLGPKEHKRLEAVADNLDLTVDYGILTIISQPLFTIMEWIHKVTNNWGWSIVFLTVLIKLAFYKLSAASYRSMASMRKLTPKLATLKERYGDDKQKFNQEMMNLYRTEKINPIGGCLPILVQMPVFLAFYWVLVESIELRQAPFMLWLQDLTAMDPYFVLPLLFGLSMFFQQKLNPAPQDPAQAMVMKAFPVIFTVFFAFFPSGLVLYWVVNNVLSIAQQWYITRKLGAL